MKIRVISFLVAVAPSLFGASGPLVNRYIPSFFSSPVNASRLLSDRLELQIHCSAGHAGRASNFEDNPQEMYKFDGLLEMTGKYDLHEIIAAAKDADPAFVSPMTLETGGSTLASRSLVFGAQSSVSLYGAHFSLLFPLSPACLIGASVPLWHVEARQRYDFPVYSGDQAIPAAQIEQVHRFRQMTHRTLGLAQKDWIVSRLGDVTCFIEGRKSWSYWWLLRTLQMAARLSVSVPTGAKADLTSPASFPMGNDASWGFSLSLMPRCELKELVWLQSPFTLTLQNPSIEQKRIPAYAEPMPFGVIQGSLKTVPGLTISWEPTLTLQHFMDNLHLMAGFSLTRHYADLLLDARSSTVKSFLTRTSIPEDSFRSVLSLSNQQFDVREMQAKNKVTSAWQRTYLLLGVQYELADFFPRLKNPPVFNVGVHYCIGCSRAARMHQAFAGISWRF